MAETVIYRSEDGHVQLSINLSKETLWLSQQQIADLFGTKRQAVTKHLKNIFLSQELDESSVCSILEHTAKDSKIYKTKFYSLDAVISVGYRINSLQATQFRIWATHLIKDHLIKGYTLNQSTLVEKGTQELQMAMSLLQKTLVHNNFVNDIGKESIQIILNYTKTWHLLLAYDENKLTLSAIQKETIKILDYQEAIQAILSLKEELITRKEASMLFGQEREKALSSILHNIEQTFFSEPLYKTPEEKAAHLFYFVIKDHPFTDGNKRIGCFLFLLYLKLQKTDINLNDNGLIALALLVAESHPDQKDLMIRLIVNLLQEDLK